MTWHSSSLLFMLFWIFIHTYPFISHFFPTVPILLKLLHLSLSVNKLPFFPLPTLLTNWPNINSSNSLCYFFKIPTCLHPFITKMTEIGILSCCCNHSAIWLTAHTIHSPRVRSMWFSSGVWPPRTWEIHSFLPTHCIPHAPLLLEHLFSSWYYRYLCSCLIPPYWTRSSLDVVTKLDLFLRFYY